MAFNPETDLEIPEVSDAEVKDFLEITPLKKPYGGKSFAGMKKVLEIIAKHVEIYAYYGQEFVMDDEQFSALKSMILPGHLNGNSLRKEVDYFVEQRMAVAREKNSEIFNRNEKSGQGTQVTNPGKPSGHSP